MPRISFFPRSPLLCGYDSDYPVISDISDISDYLRLSGYFPVFYRFTASGCKKPCETFWSSSPMQVSARTRMPASELQIICITTVVFHSFFRPALGSLGLAPSTVNFFRLFVPSDTMGNFSSSLSLRYLISDI